MIIKKTYLAYVVFFWAFSILSGCANFIDVKVTRYHVLPNPTKLPPSSSASLTPPLNPNSNSSPKFSPPVFNGQHFAMVKEVNNVEDLEFKEFVRVIANELSYLGLKESEGSDFLIDFRLSSPASVGERMQPYTIPYSRVNCFRDVYGNPNCVPITSYRTSYYPVKYNFFTNELSLFIIDAKTNQRIWQGRSEAVSYDQPNMKGLLPYLTRAALSNFPGPSGVTETVRFNLDKK
jgi:hypothetical protein